MLITFEGIDGCGKTTQMDMLSQYLKALPVPKRVVNTREPGFYDDDLSGIYRHLITEGNTTPIEKLFLLLTDRANHYRRFIIPILTQVDARRVILCDRGPDSTIAYQGFGHGLGTVEFLTECNRIAMNGVPIDLTIYLDVDPKEAAQRVTKKQYFEKEGLEYMMRVRHGFQEIAKHSDGRMVVINANQSEEETHKSIVRTVMERML